MLRFEITINGDQAVRNELRNAASSMRGRVRRATYAWAESRVMSQLAVAQYPPERPGQRYRRTGNLKRGFYINQTDRGVTIGNRMNYAGYVVGDGQGRGQAWMHKGRWYTMRSIIDKQRPRLKAGIEDEVQRLFPLARRTW